ncbi:MAG: hypothetical protein H3C47_09680 [Candidatus Cloacimonetes bacterium]|nr:hypothetical protein [Candidatus Cloacimonadota bacterium]
MNIHDRMLQKMTVAVWGDGYLAYTAMLSMQSFGFQFLVRPMIPNVSGVPTQDYPNSSQKMAWSRTGNLPDLKADTLRFQKDDRLLLSQESPAVHLVCCPGQFQGRPYNENYRRLAEMLKKLNRDEQGERLIVFCSASGPGSLERDFVDQLGESKKNWHVGVLFRSDWCVEDYFSQKLPVLASATSQDACVSLSQVAKFLGWSLEWMDCIRDAELVENARGAIEFTISGSLGQLATAYPEADIRKLSESIMQKVRQFTPVIGMATGGYRMPRSFDSLLEEAVVPESLSVFQEVRSVNYSSVLAFSEMLNRKGYKKVGILGIAPQNDFYQPPVLLLAERLHRLGCEVSLHDPCITELRERFDLDVYRTVHWDSGEMLDYDVLILGAPHPCYYNVASEDLVKRVRNCRLILDDHGVWLHMKPLLAEIYHRTGDGSLKVLE